MSWLVVYFPIDETVEVVPSSWIRDDERKCFWPPYDGWKVYECIRKRAEPDDSTWNLIDVTVMGHFDDFKVAQKKCEKAKEQDDLTSASESSKNRPMGKGHRVIKKPKNQDLYFDEYESDVVDERSMTGVSKISFPRIPFKNAATDIANDSTMKDMPPNAPQSVLPSQSAPARDDAKSSQQDSLIAMSTQLSEFIAQQQVFQKQVIRQLFVIKTQIAQLTEDVASMATNTAKTSPDENFDEEIAEIMAMFPLKSTEDISKLEEILKNPQILNKLAKELARVGGDNTKKITSRLLYQILTNEVASSYSLEGFKKKKVFKDLRLYKLFLLSVRMNQPTEATSELELQKPMRDWLAAASFRNKGKSKD